MTASLALPPCLSGPEHVGPSGVGGAQLAQACSCHRFSLEPGLWAPILSGLQGRHSSDSIAKDLCEGWDPGQRGPAALSISGEDGTEQGT